MKSIKSILAALALAMPLALTSCEGALDDIFGEWDKPSANTNTNPTPAATETYLKWNGTDALVATEIPSDAKAMSASETTWNGTYVVKEDITINDDVTLGGDVDLIILDGKTLSLASDKKIAYTGTEGYKLNIYGQSTGDDAGKLVVSTTSDAVFAPTEKLYYPIATAGTLNIHSGIVNATATGADNEGLYVGTELNVYGATVNVSTTGPGIMVDRMSGCSLNIYGGTVDVKSSENIGISCNDGDITISGGTVKATSTGTTGGNYGIMTTNMNVATKGRIVITGGNVTATGGSGAMGHGISSANSITIDGGTVKATGGTNSTGNGCHGICVLNGNISISGSTTSVTAIGGDGGTETALRGGHGLYIGNFADATIVITGGTINATAGNAGGSGGFAIYALDGTNNNAAVILNGGCKVTATAVGESGVGIKSNIFTVSGSATIVNAIGKTYGIFTSGTGNLITINDGYVFGKATGVMAWGINGTISYISGVIEGEGGEGGVGIFTSSFTNNSGASINVGRRVDPSAVWTSESVDDGYTVTQYDRYMIMPMP